ncbi:bifunctional ADP-heptose synthase (sugar kinase/adenylyltransferase) [Luteibacter sp. Sphag1AF]|uniref:hypothetical protein n=1 Tax=Luteibacter sp. Sphag1AF TaxID=2587031 RepID=UPI00161A5EB9|nr:hypothetical protein [Luteibacter sp. Sphag1AF]MBB3226983.1 bifunctional ADP-heptose synthase (sugar kinase/adenylyltransferase) [Luteibacter sp. Sphag1AF]
MFTIAANNSPAGSDAIGNSLDDYLRAGFAITRSTNGISSASIPSASTTDLGTADAEAVTVTGASTITSFGTVAAGIKREVYFSGACTIKNSSAIVLVGGGDITTNAGDVITFRSQGSGNWTQVNSSRPVGDITLSGKNLVSAKDSTIANSVNNPTRGLVIQAEVSGTSA